MKRMLSLVLALFCVFSTAGNVFAEGQKIKLSTLDWPPYIGQGLPGKGFVAEITLLAFKKAGYDVEMEFLPWARAVYTAKRGESAGYFPEYYAKDIEADFVFSDAIMAGPLGFFKRKGMDIPFKTLEDLKPYTIGIVNGYINTEEFDKADYLKKDPANDDETNLKKLLKERIEIAVCDKYVGMYIIDQNLPEAKGQLEFMEPALEMKDLFVCFSKKYPGYEKVMADFNAALKQMKDAGEIEAILKKYNLQ